MIIIIMVIMSMIMNIIIIIMIDIIIVLLWLMVWLLFVFLVGLFSYSYGLEWVVYDGYVVDIVIMSDWLCWFVICGFGWNDVVFCVE
ncbi:urease accessory protein ureF 1, partial [Enterococcus hirae]